MISALYTAIIAMVISSVVALLVLGSLRDDFAAHVAERADRATAAYEARRAAEDTDDPRAAADDAAETAITTSTEPPPAAPSGPTTGDGAER